MLKPIFFRCEQKHTLLIISKDIYKKIETILVIIKWEGGDQRMQ